MKKPTTTENKAATKTARIYGRFSSGEQADGDSEKRQLDRCHKAAQHAQLAVLKIYFDRGISAKDGLNKEKQFGQLLKDLQTGEWVVCETHDRLSRQNPIMFGYPIADIIKKGGNVLLANGETYTPENIDELEKVMGASIGGAMAQGTNKRRNDMVSKAYASKYEALEKGEKPLMPFYPSWIRFHKYNKAYEPIPERVKIVQRIFDEYLAGKGTSSIAHGLTKDKIPTFRKDGNIWWQAQVQQILRSISVTGVLKLKGKVYANYFPPALKNPDDYYRVKELLAQRRGKRHGRLDLENVRDLFRGGIATCSKCGNSLWAAKDKSGKCSYRCLGRLNHDCTVSKGIAAKDIEIPILKALGGAINAELNKDNSPTKRIAELNGKLASITEEKEAVMLLLKRKVAVATVEKNLRELDSQEETINAELAMLKGKNSAMNDLPANSKTLLILTAKGAFDNETRRQINNLLPSIVDGIVFDLENGIVIATMKNGTKHAWLMVPSQTITNEQGEQELIEGHFAHHEMK